MTGIFRWLKSNGGKAYLGEIAGCQMLVGYIHIKLGKVDIYAHRIAWWFHYGQFPKDQVDHIKGNKADNWIINLREATNAQNHMNNRPPSRNTSGTKGVYWIKAKQCWNSLFMLAAAKYISVDLTH